MPKIILFVASAGDRVWIDDKIACYLAADTLPEQKISEIINTGKMVLAFGAKALEMCQKYNLDGVVKEPDVSKPLKIQLKELRECLKKKTLGVIIPAHRHEAMLAGEIEPEFIIFRPTDPARDKEILSWYNDLFLIPSAWFATEGSSSEEFSDVDFVVIGAKNFENFGC